MELFLYFALQKLLFFDPCSKLSCLFWWSLRAALPLVIIRKNGISDIIILIILKVVTKYLYIK